MQSQTRQASIECKYILVHSPTCGIQCKYIEGSHHSIAFNAKMHFGVHIHTSLGGQAFLMEAVFTHGTSRTMRIYISGNERRVDPRGSRRFTPRGPDKRSPVDRNHG